MITGMGIDIVEIDRIQKVVQRQKGFVDRILCKEEKKHYELLSPHRKIEFLAGRFAAKEAYAKAVGTGIGKNLSFRDICILPDKHGKPFIHLESKAHTIHLSISHSKHYAIANVIIEYLSS